MNDRFKFRIWNGTEMHYNDFVVTATGFLGKITEEFLGQCVFKQDDLTTDNECILMQSTGLKDKNGKLIYEGDIVIDTGNSQMIAEVKYQKCSFTLENKGFIGYYHELGIGFSSKRLEVIGNMYENKELLESEE